MCCGSFPATGQALAWLDDLNLVDGQETPHNVPTAAAPTDPYENPVNGAAAPSRSGRITSGSAAVTEVMLLHRQATQAAHTPGHARRDQRPRRCHSRRRPQRCGLRIAGPASLNVLPPRSLDNLEALLDGAGMTLANIARLNIYTIDVDQELVNFEAMGSRLRAAGVTPAMTVLV